MDTKEIKKLLLIDKGLTITAIAQTIEEDRSHVSKVPSYDPPNQRIRKKIERKFRIRFDRPQRRAA